MQSIFRLIVLSTLLTALLQPSFADSQYDWQLVRDEDGIQIYVKKIWADPVQAFRGVIHINASVNSLTALIMDIEAGADWIHHCKNPVLLFRKSISDCIHYQVHHLPFPFHNREFIFHSKVSRSAQTGVVHIKMDIAKNFCRDHKEKCESINTPSASSYVRVTHSHGHYLLEPLGHKHSKVTWTHHTHPGGNLPLWLVNQLIQTMPYETLQGLRKKVSQEKYQKARLTIDAQGNIVNLFYAPLSAP